MSQRSRRSKKRNATLAKAGVKAEVRVQPAMVAIDEARAIAALEAEVKADYKEQAEQIAAIVEANRILAEKGPKVEPALETYPLMNMSKRPSPIVSVGRNGEEWSYNLSYWSTARVMNEEVLVYLYLYARYLIDGGEAMVGSIARHNRALVEYILTKEESKSLFAAYKNVELFASPDVLAILEKYDAILEEGLYIPYLEYDCRIEDSKDHVIIPPRSDANAEDFKWNEENCVSLVYSHEHYAYKWGRRVTLEAIAKREAEAVAKAKLIAEQEAEALVVRTPEEKAQARIEQKAKARVKAIARSEERARVKAEKIAKKNQSQTEGNNMNTQEEATSEEATTEESTTGFFGRAWKVVKKAACSWAGAGSFVGLIIAGAVVSPLVLGWLSYTILMYVSIAVLVISLGLVIWAASE